MVTSPTKAAVAKSDEVVEETLGAAKKAANDAPAAVREMAEKSVQQAKEGYSRWKSAAEETSDAFEDAYASASKGYKELSRRSVELTRTNLNAHFDFLQALINAKSVSQAIELQTSFARQQFEALSGQVKEISTLAQKATQEGARPFQDLAGKGVRLAQMN